MTMHGFPNRVKNLKNCPKKRVFTMEILYINNNINILSFEKNFNLLATSKVKYRSSRIYLKMALPLPGDINLNPVPVNGYHIRGHNVFSSKGLHFFHRNINRLLPEIEKLPQYC